jgi:hypothetical protein
METELLVVKMFIFPIVRGTWGNDHAGYKKDEMKTDRAFSVIPPKVVID